MKNRSAISRKSHVSSAIAAALCLAPLTPQAGVLFQEDFNTDLTGNNWTISNNDDSPAQFIGIDNGSFYVNRDVSGGNGGGAIIYTDTDIALNGSTHVSFDANPILRSVADGCGFTCEEMPINLELTMQDTNGADFVFRYAMNYGGAVTDVTRTVSGSFTSSRGYYYEDGYEFIQIGESIAQNSFTSIVFDIEDYVPDAASIKQIAIYGSGWDYQGRMDNLLIENDASVPTPTAFTLMLGGLLCLGWSARKSKQN